MIKPLVSLKLGFQRRLFTGDVRRFLAFCPGGLTGVPTADHGLRILTAGTDADSYMRRLTGRNDCFHYVFVVP
jgi:hypothetical protein